MNHSPFRKAFSTDLSAMILADLSTVAKERNDKNPDRQKIHVTRQTNVSGKIFIDINLLAEYQAVESDPLCRLEINTHEDELILRSNTAMPKKLPMSVAHKIKQHMAEIIASH